MTLAALGPAPTILITAADPAATADPELTRRKNELYGEAIRRAGGEPLLLDARADEKERAAAFRAMDGLVLSGGADLDPALYRRAPEGASTVEPERDALEQAAWDEAAAARLPVLGLCRGFQAINVFSGGTLIQHVEGHRGPGWGEGPALMHRLRVDAGSRLARVLRPTNPTGLVLQVNSYHHQAVGRAELARGLVASAWSAGPDGELVEGFESEDPGRFLVGVQCHPERTESTPPEFERLFRVFVDAARGPTTRRTGAGAGEGSAGRRLRDEVA
ncbi:MAG: hypothetical protein A2X23_04780 [Chloroflexi bacterium GWC2_73_18]|nr:MAG: hypothetical protein A2X23_04780 [Chloroflexi bacterium GWC2_73_18]